MTCTRPDPARPMLLAASLSLLATACASGGDPSRPPVFMHEAEYRVSCSISDDCRVQYIDEAGVLRARDVVGEWSLSLGIDPGGRMWVRASGGGCPPRPLRVEIWLDGVTVAQNLERAKHQSRCDWLLSETEFVVP